MPSPPGEPQLPEVHQNIGAPARRALANAGVRQLTDLQRFSEADLLALHGMGPKAMRILREAMTEQGLTFADA